MANASRRITKILVISAVIFYDSTGVIVIVEYAFKVYIGLCINT
jgi:hypothetical protein